MTLASPPKRLPNVRDFSPSNAPAGTEYPRARFGELSALAWDVVRPHGPSACPGRPVAPGWSLSTTRPFETPTAYLGVPSAGSDPAAHDRVLPSTATVCSAGPSLPSARPRPETPCATYRKSQSARFLDPSLEPGQPFSHKAFLPLVKSPVRTATPYPIRGFSLRRSRRRRPEGGFVRPPGAFALRVSSLVARAGLLGVAGPVRSRSGLVLRVAVPSRVRFSLSPGVLWWR